MINKTNNPIIVMFLACSLIITGSATLYNAIAMAFAIILVLVINAAIFGLLKKVINEDIRLITKAIIIATVSIIVTMLINAFVPNGYKGIELPLATLAVDLLVWIDSKNNNSISGSLKNALSAAGFIVIMGAIRELLGSGKLLGYAIPFFKDHTIAIFNNVSGGLLVFACGLAILNKKYPVTKSDIAGLFDEEDK